VQPRVKISDNARLADRRDLERNGE